MSVVVHDTQVVLCIDLTLFRGAGEPFECFFVILRHALTIVVEHSQRILRTGVAWLGSFAIPVGRFDNVLSHGSAMLVVPAKVELRIGVTALSGGSGFRLSSPEKL